MNNAICRDYTGLDTLGVSGILRKLRNRGLLEQHSHASATFYTPTGRLLHPEIPDLQNKETQVPPRGTESHISSIMEEGSITAMPGGKTGSEKVLPATLNPLPAKREGDGAGKESLPATLEMVIQNLGRRSSPAEVQAVIVELCTIRPYTRAELGKILHRSPKWIYDSYLSPLLRDGIIELYYRDKASSPNQAYRVRTGEKKE
ncbi:MAG: hypothetical protein JXA44_02290 [Methanospirillaceae archaeon]|nr:hypothetical protein [Methanospirillaceae archaeon]